MKTDNPLYISKAFSRSLWQEYRIYANRVELDFHVLIIKKNFIVSFDQIQKVFLRPPLVFADFFRGDFPLKVIAKTLKLDLADLFNHVLIIKKKGFHLRFTPENPNEFKTILEQSIAAYLSH